MLVVIVFLFCNDTATTEIYTYGHTLSLHDALPICMTAGKMAPPKCPPHPPGPDDILSDLAATHQEAPQGGKITRPQVILFPMVSEFARKFQIGRAHV